MITALVLGAMVWFGLLAKAQRNRRKGYICRVPPGERGCGGDDESQPAIQQVPMTNQQNLMNQAFENIQMPYMQSQYGLYKDVYEPATRALGGVLGDQLKQPMSLPENVWSELWQKQKANVSQGYNEQRQTAGERFAGKGTLNSPISEKYFQSLDLSQAKSLEEMAADMAIASWQDKVQAKQTSISNQMSFLGMTPNFSISPQIPQSYTQMGGDNGDYSGLGMGLGAAGGLALGALLAPATGGLSLASSLAFPLIGGGIGAAAGGGIGSMIRN